MKRFIAYYPEYDALNNCDWQMPVDDFREETEASMRKATAELPTSDSTHFTQPSGSVLLEIEASGIGLTYSEIRKAADAYLEKHGITPKSLESE